MDPTIKGAELVLMSKARGTLPALTSWVSENPFHVVELTRRTKSEAFIVSRERFSPLLEALQPANGALRLEEVLVWVLVESWLGTAAPHLKAPQTAELKTYSISQLLAVLGMDPDSPKLDVFEDEKAASVLNRLVKRRAVAKAIAAADEQGSRWPYPCAALLVRDPVRITKGMTQHSQLKPCAFGAEGVSFQSK